MECNNNGIVNIFFGFNKELKHRTYYLMISFKQVFRRYKVPVLVVVVLLIVYYIVFIREREIAAESLFHDKFENYRLGDVIEHPNKKMTSFDNKTPGVYHKEVFPSSIASKYITESKSKPRDWKVLQKVLQERCPAVLEGHRMPKAVVHLRLGDVVDKAILESRPNDVHVHMRYIPAEKYIKVAEELKRRKIKNVTLIGGIHVRTSEDKIVDPQYSLDYIKDVRKILKSKGINSNFMSNEPDVDFCMMTSTPFVVTGMGNFGRLVGKIAKLNKNIVYTPFNHRK